MRQREERQREGNASQHWESLYLHHSLSPSPILSLKHKKHSTLLSHSFSLCL